MTLSKSIVMLSVGALIVTCYASSADISYSDFMDHLYRETMEYKHDRCFRPDSVSYTDPKRVYQSLANRTIQRWFYDPFIRACRPLFTGANYVIDADSKDYNLPHTRIECETLCGSYCLVGRRDGTTEMGICMALDFDGGVPNTCTSVLPEAHPKQCPQSYSKCCPRRYRDLIDTPVTSATVAPPRRQNRSEDETVARESRRYNAGSLWSS